MRNMFVPCFQERNLGEKPVLNHSVFPRAIVLFIPTLRPQVVAHGMIVPVRAIFMANEVGTHLDRFFVLSEEEKIEVPLRCYGLRADIQV
jgi:hypothetical protein